MAENLKVTHYNDGSEIPTGYSNSEWAELETGAYAVYDDDPTNSETYGRLYNWYTVDDSRGLCMEGWHVPSDEEYTVLKDYLGGTSVAGGKMKEAGLEHWNYYSDEITEEATNESGFTGLPAGYRDGSYGFYNNMGNYGFFWSSSEYYSANVWYRVLSYGYSSVNRSNGNKQFGFSIRCLADEITTGCTDPEACNYDASVTADDGSCEYEVDCAGTCGGDLEFDCCGACGGDNSQCSSCCGSPLYEDCTDDCAIDLNGICCYELELDECMLCYGDGSSCTNEEATLSFGEVDLASQTIEIHLENSAPVSGFQFLLSSADYVDFVDAYGGSSEENGFTVELGGNNIVLGFSLSATEIPTGNDILTYIEFDGFTSNEICLSEGVITSGYEDAQYLDVSYGDCISLYSKGDVNMDGVLDVLDIVTIVNIIFETIDPDDYQLWASDYNSDGDINIMDIVQIVNAIFSDDVIIEGCMDDTACNYNPDANVEGDCEYFDECGECGGNNDCIGCNDWYMENFICDDTDSTDKCCVEDDNNNDNRCKINGTGNNCDFSLYCQEEYEMECDLDGEYCDYEDAEVGTPCSTSEGSFTEGEGLCVLDLSDDVNFPTGFITYYDTGCADGTDSCCTEPECNEPFTLSLEYIDASTLQVNYSSTEAIAGFQFEIVGATTTGGSGGDAEANNLLVLVTGGNIALSSDIIGGSSIPAGSGILTNLNVDTGVSIQLCLQNVIISDPESNEINTCPEYWQLTCIPIP